MRKLFSVLFLFKWLRYLYTLAFILLFSYSSYAEYSFSTNCRNAYQCLVSLKIDEAHKYILAEKISAPKNLLPSYLENFSEFLVCVLDEDRNYFEKCKKNEEPRIEAWENSDDNSPFRIYIIAETRLQWALLKAKFGDPLGAALDLNSSYRWYQKNQELYPNFAPNKKGLGILHTLFSLIPDEYSWLFKILGYKGSLRQGLSELVNAFVQTHIYPEYKFLRTELLFIISFIHINLINQQKDLESIKKHMIAEGSDQPLLLFARVNIEMKSGQNNAALTLMESRPRSNEYHPFYYLDYLEGIARLNQLDLSAINHFEFFLSHYKGYNYIKSALQKIAWCYLLNENRTKYTEFIQKISTAGSVLVDEDKQAQKEFALKIPPNVVLLKARLLCDGGYYEKALSTLTDKNNLLKITSEQDLLELQYRMGRIFHKLKKIAEAISYYEKTIIAGKDKPYYFAANAALELGIIYEEKKNYSAARKNYNLCLSMKNHEYRNSLEQKAKAGLSRIP
ncbi:MAG: tetratricopeptide repeat protein [Bacteroidota bacterium]